MRNIFYYVLNLRKETRGPHKKFFSKIDRKFGTYFYNMSF